MEQTKQSTNKKKKVGKAYQYIQLYYYILNCPAYRSLSHPARSLLIDIAKQYNGNNNGDLCTTMSILKPLGWRSHDVVDRAKAELLERGFIQETRKGKRPNIASLYAITWQPLNPMDKLEVSPNDYKPKAFMYYKPPD